MGVLALDFNDRQKILVEMLIKQKGYMTIRSYAKNSMSLIEQFITI